MDLGSLIASIVHKLQVFIPELQVAEIVVGALEIILLGLLLSFIYHKYIKATSSETHVKAFFVLILMWLVSEILMFVKLSIFAMFLKALVAIVIFGLIVIFQPELRRFLGYLGQGNLFSRVFLCNRVVRSDKDEKTRAIKELIETVKYLSKNRIGALIVLQKDKYCQMPYEVGTEINADISQELLLTIFYPSTPLHDGAVVIVDDKILSAGVLLPLTEDPKLSWRYGTRHRAALGVSETSNCACIVVSEETGDVSIAIAGELKKYEDLGQIKPILERIMFENEEDEESKKSFLFKLDKKEDDATKVS